ncbi:MAG: hypothetical protein M5U34_23905 [Chloroflexi bacterium]|nr:hypothetical protein [Chloroflexota bacterium]
MRRGFHERFAHSLSCALNGGGWYVMRVWRRALGVVKRPFPPSSPLLSDPEPLIRGHAAWALQQIDTREAKTAVAAALAVEKDTRVCEEMEAK